MEDKLVPNHIGIILDGNRRWAKERNLSPHLGHNQGLKQVEPVVKQAFRSGVKFVSLFVFSTENWRRTAQEVEHLMKLFLMAFKNESNRLLAENYRLFFAGQRDDNIKPEIRDVMSDIEAKSLKNSGPTVIACFNYGGRLEIVDACKKLIRAGVKPDDLTEEDIQKSLYQPDVPDIDLLIRTSGERRISGFQIWRASYAEMLFVDKYWPDFQPEDMQASIEDYGRRQRRFGK